MMEYAEIYRLGADGLEMVGIVDDFSRFYWKTDYFGAGQIEIKAPVTRNNLSLLKAGNYVLTPDGGETEVGIIERVGATTSLEEGTQIIASGRMAKSILDRRIIYSPVFDAGEGGNGYIWHSSAKTLTGKVDAAAALLVKENAAQPVNPDARLKGDRTLPAMAWDPADGVSKYPETIAVEVKTDVGTAEEDADKQVTYKNLLDYTDGLLQEYGLGARLWLDRGKMRLRYQVYKGRSLSRTNHPDGEPITFSQEMDNLTSTKYVYDESLTKTVAFIGGEGEGIERKCAFAYEWVSGMDRREVFVDASSITTETEEGEPPLSLEAYRKQLEAQGQQSVAESPIEETLTGEIDITNSPVRFRRDFYVGDIVTIEDTVLGLAIEARITSVTVSSDEKGPQIAVEYGRI